MAERPITLAYRVQAIGARAMFALFGALPLDAASALGGWLGRMIGPRLAMNRRARRNIARALPELSEPEIESVIRGMWDNLGRVTAEYPHLHKFDCYASTRIEVIGAEYVDQLREDGRGGIFFSGHIANWEVCCLAATQRGVPVFQAYRAPNNPLIDPIIDRIRTRALGAPRYAKGARGARQLIKHLKNGDHLALLIDQKLNEGIPVPFFGRDAMTMTAMASFALKFDIPVVPARVVRLRGARFRIIIDPPMEIAPSGEHDADIADIMGRATAMIENWVRAHPEQWFWLHRRWPD
jgi:KDO2-lipid IV(A) lauroyltransferase